MNRNHFERTQPFCLPLVLLLVGASVQAGGPTPCPSASFSLAPRSAGASSDTQNLPVGLSPMFAMVGRFNGDAYPDIATANLGGNDVSILLGAGNGTFNPAPGSPIVMAASPGTNGSRPIALASGLFNADTHLDIAVSNRNSGTVTILLGSATGSFINHTTYTGFGSPHAIAAADFDGDGKGDFAVVNNSNSAVHIYRGVGDGNFVPFAGSPIAVAGVNLLQGITAGQLIGNADIDLAVTGNGSDNVGVLRGNGDGSFTLVSTHTVVTDASAAPITVTHADVNRDGFSDLLIANLVIRGNAAVPVSPHNQTAVLLGTAVGFLPVSHVWLGGDLASVTVVDINRDQIPDLLGANRAFSFSGSVALGNGDGSFAAASSYAAGGNPLHVAYGDFNIDGAADFVVVNQPSNTLSVYLNNCSGNAPPIAFNDAGAGFSTDEDSTVNLPNLLLNDLDPNGDTLLIEDFQHSGAGVVTVSATGAATFNPNNQFEALDAGETASEQFSYTVGDGNGDAAVGTVTVLIHGVTDPRDLGLSYGSPQLPGIVLVGDVVIVNIGISNLSTQDVSGGTLAISIPTGMTVGDTGFCIAQPNSVQCNFGLLAAGATISASFSLTLDASAIGLREIAFALSGNEPDVTMANNAGSLSADVRPVAIFADAFED